MLMNLRSEVFWFRILTRKKYFQIVFDKILTNFLNLNMQDAMARVIFIKNEIQQPNKFLNLIDWIILFF